jgi:cytochrome c oxidase cbb3-type subunit 2
VLSLSAYTDPLTGERMQIAQRDRAALNDPATRASESHYAYKAHTADPATYYAGEAWARKHGFDFAEARAATQDERDSR